jgi:hypothetical protein
VVFLVAIDIKKLKVGDTFICPITNVEQTVFKIDDNNVYTKDKNGVIRSAFKN